VLEQRTSSKRKRARKEKAREKYEERDLGESSI